MTDLIDNLELTLASNGTSERIIIPADSKVLIEVTLDQIDTYKLIKYTIFGKSNNFMVNQSAFQFYTESHNSIELKNNNFKPLTFKLSLV